MLGVQPGFREPYPESVYTEAHALTFAEDDGGYTDEHFHLQLHVDVSHIPSQQRRKSGTTSRPTGDLESIVTQSLVDSESVPRTMDSSRVSSHSQHLSGVGELDSKSTLGDLSPSRSLVITSSPWLKSSASKNLDLSTDDRREGEGVQRVSDGRRESNVLHNPPRMKRESFEEVESLQGTWRSGAVLGTPIEEKLDALESPLGESLDQVGLLGDQDQLQSHPACPGIPGRSVTLSLFARNVETRCTHYTHSSSALSGGAGIPGSHVAPSTVYRHSVYSPLTIDVENEESGGLSSGGTVSHAMFESWPSEVALAYTLNMSDVVIYGRTSRIQSTALEGTSSGEGGISGFGLKQLAGFSHTEHSSSGKSGKNSNHTYMYNVYVFVTPSILAPAMIHILLYNVHC